MARAIWAIICLGTLTGGACSSAWAVERELAGVRLGEMALGLLDKPGYGEPDFIGPLGSIAIASVLQGQVLGQTAPTALARPGLSGGTARRGPAGPAGRMEDEGMRGGEGRGGGAGARRGTTGAGALSRPAAAGGAQGGGAGMYWYYRRLGGAVVVLSLDLRGEVKAITLTGDASYLAGRTSRSIGLTNSYMEIIGQYGYPDQVITAGNQIELTYVDHGVRFSLENMRVREIAIGAHIGQTIQTAPALPVDTGPPPAGLGVEELRGYL